VVNELEVVEDEQAWERPIMNDQDAPDPHGTSFGQLSSLNLSARIKHKLNHRCNPLNYLNLSARIRHKLNHKCTPLNLSSRMRHQATLSRRSVDDQLRLLNKKPSHRPREKEGDHQGQKQT
jgi:hypothetical protein